MTWMLLLGFLAASLPLAAVTSLSLWLEHKRTAAWMRILSAERGLPVSMVDNGHSETVRTPLKQDTRRRVTVPLPGFMWKGRPVEPVLKAREK